MPRGVPKNGFRMTRRRMMQAKVNPQLMPRPVSNETEEQIRAKLTERFAAMDMMTEAAMSGDVRAVIVSGPPGLGKSFSIMKILEQANPYHTIIRGYVRPTGLYKTLYEYRHPGSVVVFDDADSVFLDEVSLNLLKTASDTTKKRTISWLSESKMLSEEGDNLPRSFDFEGTIIFITNYDFDEMIDRGSKLAPHFQALISRSMYLDMAMKTNKDYMVRIKQVVEQGMLTQMNISKVGENLILSFIEKNQDKMRELSLRMVAKLGALMKSHPNKWESLARVVCCK